MGRQLLLCCTLLPVESSRVGIEDRKTRLPVVLKRRLERQQWIPVRPGWMVKPMKASHWEDIAAELVGSSSARSPSQVFATCRTQNEVVVARKSPCRFLGVSRDDHLEREFHPGPLPTMASDATPQLNPARSSMQ